LGGRDDLIDVVKKLGESGQGLLAVGLAKSITVLGQVSPDLFEESAFFSFRVP
jgi:hypothetical protein